MNASNQLSLSSSYEVLLPRRVVRTILASFFFLAYVVTPYWLLPPSNAGRFAILVLTIFLGIVWSHWSAGDLRFRVDGRSWPLKVAAVALLLAVNARTLVSVIPWRGDEDFHLLKTLSVAVRVPWSWFFLIVVGFMLAVYLAWKHSRWLIELTLLSILGAVLLIARQYPFSALGAVFLLRYPFVNYWLYAIVPRLASVLGNPYQEILYRVIPAFSAAAIAWAVLPHPKRSSLPLMLLWDLAVITAPIIFYYSSIEYLELLVVWLMLMVCLHTSDFLNPEFETVKNRPAWYALILIGFLKETAAPFIVCVLVLRILSITRTSLRRMETRNNAVWQPNWRQIQDEARLVAAVLIPWALYMLLRSLLVSTRQFTINLHNLLDPRIYVVMAQALFDQFGLFLVLFVVGCGILLKRRQPVLVVFWFGVLVSTLAFFAIDSKLYVGYSRFNLLLLPPMLAGSTLTLNWLSERPRALALGAATLVLVANLWQSPINLDGTKKPGWGSYLMDTAEHYYPYKDALLWIKNKHPKARLLVTGAYYPYNAIGFYLTQLDWHPHYKQTTDPRICGPNADCNEPAHHHDTSAADISHALSEADANGYNVVLFHLLGTQVPQTGTIAGFQLEKAVSNQAHTLLIYCKIR